MKTKTCTWIVGPVAACPGVPCTMVKTALHANRASARPSWMTTLTLPTTTPAVLPIARASPDVLLTRTTTTTTTRTRTTTTTTTTTTMMTTWRRNHASTQPRTLSTMTILAAPRNCARPRRILALRRLPRARGGLRRSSLPFNPGGLHCSLVLCFNFLCSVLNMALQCALVSAFRGSSSALLTHVYFLLPLNVFLSFDCRVYLLLLPNVYLPLN